MPRIDRGLVTCRTQETTPGHGWWFFYNRHQQIVWEAPFAPVASIGTRGQQWLATLDYVRELGYTPIAEELTCST